MPHIHEQIDFTSEVFVVYKNKVLLRKHDKFGIWMSVGGHIELDEDPNQAAIREVKEEVGLDILLDHKPQLYQQDTTGYTELIPPYFMHKHTINETHSHVTLVYFATTNTDVTKDSVLEYEKNSPCKWFTQEEIEKNVELLPDIKFAALKALDVLKT